MSEVYAVLTYLDDDYPALFVKIKRRRWKWSFVVEGEWSQFPVSSGRCTLWAASSDDRRTWALLSDGFPRRIVAVAQSAPTVRLEEVASMMMAVVKANGGEFVDTVHRFGNFDHDLFWQSYERFASVMRQDKKRSSLAKGGA